MPSRSSRIAAAINGQRAVPTKTNPRWLVAGPALPHKPKLFKEHSPEFAKIIEKVKAMKLNVQGDGLPAEKSQPAK